MKKCVFFDRDGIVNRSPWAGYVERWEDFELVPEFVDVLRMVRELGYEAVVVSNQRGVARGIMSPEAVEEIHRNLRAVLSGKYNLELLDILYCPHNEGECECRKPKPGMLIEAARRHGLDLKSSWMIGDQESDIEAGKRAGCRTILVAREVSETQADVSRRPVTPTCPTKSGFAGRRRKPSGEGGSREAKADFVVNDLKALETLLVRVLA